jgi:anti-sigma factor RsiW
MGALMNERTIELINAEIDGVLNGPDRAELNRLLLADPAVRELRDQLRQACAALDAVEPEDIPADLHASIMAALPGSAVQDQEPARAGRYGKPVFRYAAAFAGGLLVSALAFHFSGTGSPGLGTHELAGTLAPASVHTLRIDLPQVQGQVALSGSAEAPLLVTRLAATAPVQLIASLDGKEVRLDDFVAPQSAPVQLSAGLGASASAVPLVKVTLIDMASGTVLLTAVLSPNVPDGK